MGDGWFEIFNAKDAKDNRSRDPFRGKTKRNEWRRA
jgi:hypothetical protein